MAEIQTTEIIDDLTGRTLERENLVQVHFSIDSNNYRLDVDKEGAKALFKVLEGFIPSATRIYPKKAKASMRKKSTGEQTRMRAWAREHGFEVADQGRIPERIKKAYRESSNS